MNVLAGDSNIITTLPTVNCVPAPLRLATAECITPPGNGVNVAVALNGATPPNIVFAVVAIVADALNDATPAKNVLPTVNCVPAPVNDAEPGLILVQAAVCVALEVSELTPASVNLPTVDCVAVELRLDAKVTDLVFLNNVAEHSNIGPQCT